MQPLFRPAYTYEKFPGGLTMTFGAYSIKSLNSKRWLPAETCWFTNTAAWLIGINITSAGAEMSDV